jgi:hypothetical protein
MSSEAKLMQVPTPVAAPVPEKRRRGRPAEAREKGGATALFYLGEASEQTSGRITLKEECASEGEAMVESLKKGVTYFRIEVWKARAVIKDGGVEVMKDQISVRA